MTPSSQGLEPATFPERFNTTTHLDDTDRMRVAVRIDTDHVVQLICKHPH